MAAQWVNPRIAGRFHSRESQLQALSHYGADMTGVELANWLPTLTSADGSMIEERDRLQARTRDLIRNHGLLSGAVQTHLDNVVGRNLRLSAKPDWRALGLSSEWAREWSRDVETKFRLWGYDINHYCDASRRHDFGGLIAQGYRSYLTAFEALAVAEWRADAPASVYKTAIQMVDPARLSTPNGKTESDRLRAGIEMDAMGAPTAYWIASGLVGDPLSLRAPMLSWRRVPRETSWGRAMVIHVYDSELPGQSRGKTGIVSVIAKSKMLERFEGVTLQAAILNAMYAAVIESSMPWDVVGGAIGVPGANDPSVQYLQNRSTFHKEGHIRFNGVKIPHLYPGEQLKLTTPQHPSAAFGAFEEATLRHIAGGLNLSYEQLSRDYSKTNYSSARAAMLEAYRFFSGRRHAIAGRLATQIYALWLEEAMDRGDVERPPGAPSFWDAKTAWTWCKWIGPGRGHIDPRNESEATTNELNMNLTTLEKEAAERGEDWEELLEQRALEKQRARELGVESEPRPVTQQQQGVGRPPVEDERP
jgi:lambda family phage portal protein